MPYSFPVKAIVLLRSIQVAEAPCQLKSTEYLAWLVAPNILCVHQTRQILPIAGDDG